MRIYFHKNARSSQRLQRLCDAAARGFVARHIPVMVHDFDDYRAEPVVTVLNSSVPNREIGVLRDLIISRQKDMGYHTIVLDHGYVDRKDYWSVGVDGINGLAKFIPPAGPDRWEALGRTIEPWRDIDHGDHVLVIGQCPDDPQVMMTGHWEWCEHTIREAHGLRLPVIFRPHPRANTPVIPMPVGTIVVDRNQDIDTLISRARLVVTYNSTTAIQSVCRGVHTIAQDRRSMVYDAAYPSIQSYRAFVGSWALDDSCRALVFHRIGYSQWTLGEIASGVVWKKLWETVLCES